MNESFDVAQEKKYWLGFSFFPGIGPVRFAQLLDQFGSAERAWKASEKELFGSNLYDSTVKQFLSFRTSFNLEKYEELLATKKVTAVLLSDQLYPQPLKELKDAPFVLYVRGQLEEMQEAYASYVAIVGTRKVTSYGAQVTQTLTKALVGAGSTIVSGLAYGVDSIAHQTTLASNGKTIAVLGCGVDYCYPRSNQRLYEEIIGQGGAIVSEYPLGSAPTRGSFPSRNRIIAGLSQATIVTEGTSDSGALITADEAFKLQRKVFAVPGPITSTLSEGPNLLLVKGATLVTSGKDILSELGIKNNELGTKERKAIKGGTPDERMILDLLQRESLQFDQLVRQTTFDTVKLGTLLSMMELKGMIGKNDNGAFACL
jgi:DNA processing protein